MKIVFSYYFHNVPLYSSYSQREYLSSQINISNPFFHRPRVGGFLLLVTYLFLEDDTMDVEVKTIV